MQAIKHHSIDESIYHHAFKYFSEGLTNQAIKTRLAVSKYNIFYIAKLASRNL